MVPIRERGIGLLEAMVALAILAIAGLGLSLALTHYAGQSSTLTQIVTAQQANQRTLYQSGTPSNTVTANVQITSPTTSSVSVSIPVVLGSTPEVSQYAAYP